MLNYAALLVDRYGEKFWPIFERLETELEGRKSRARRIGARLNKNSLPTRTNCNF